MLSALSKSDDALASLTGALVDANDRLLGLLSLITDDPPPSLTTKDLVDSILNRAAPLLGLDHVELSGASVHTWGEIDPSELQGSWSVAREVPEVGIVEIQFDRSLGRFDTGDTKLLAAVAQLVGNAVATAELHRVSLAQQAIAHEHSAAARITSLALPPQESIPSLDGLTLFASLVPARMTGGDLYTWKLIDGDLWFAMGDVSGKGLPAAVLMSTVVNAVEGSISRHASEGLTAVLGAVDRWVHARLSDAAMFVTMAIGRWSPATGELVVVNSGHSPIVYCREGSCERVNATAPPIGVILGCEATPWIRKTQAGDVLVLATDGFTEQDNLAGEHFGEDHFDERLVALSGSADASILGEKLLVEIETHSVGCEQSDDRALMVLRFS